jgi:hypothetical protein
MRPGMTSLQRLTLVEAGARASRRSYECAGATVLVGTLLTLRDRARERQQRFSALAVGRREPHPTWRSQVAAKSRTRQSRCRSLWQEMWHGREPRSQCQRSPVIAGSNSARLQNLCGRVAHGSVGSTPAPLRYTFRPFRKWARGMRPPLCRPRRDSGPRPLEAASQDGAIIP